MLDWRERRLLYVEGAEGLEPAWLWLTEQGLPMLPDRWNAVFRQANLRCERALLTGAEREMPRMARVAEIRGRVPYATPHSARHSMALYMLVVLNELMDRRYGLTAADRRDFTQLYGDPWWLVKTLLGHQDVETTKMHYLAPVTHLQLESILAFDSIGGDPADTGDPASMDDLFARLAKETTGIQDVDILVDNAPTVRAPQ